MPSTPSLFLVQHTVFVVSLDCSAITRTCMIHVQILVRIKDVEEIKAVTCSYV